MSMGLLFLCLCAAHLLDGAAGYPDLVYRNIGHPVTWIGALVGALDRGLNRPDDSPFLRRLMGMFAALVIVALPAAIAWALQGLMLQAPIGWIGVAVAASTCLAARSLYDHVRAVADALRSGGVDTGRAAVGRIVGRDTAVLDSSGVCRAAIESLAENASDGVVAPALWFAVAGLPGIVAYKAINTADSMIGHRTPRHEAFGWAAARIDDLVNLPASRLTGVLFAASALFLEGASARDAMRAMARDANRHRSPNAGWPESAMAGALGLTLAGPRSYQGEIVDDATMGDGRRDAGPGDIDRALKLAGRAWMMLVGAVGVAAVVLLTVPI